MPSCRCTDAFRCNVRAIAAGVKGAVATGKAAAAGRLVGRGAARGAAPAGAPGEASGGGEAAVERPARCSGRPAPSGGLRRRGVWGRSLLQLPQLLRRGPLGRRRSPLRPGGGTARVFRIASRQAVVEWHLVTLAPWLLACRLAVKTVLET